QSDTRGAVKGTFDSDRGLVKIWYNRAGQIRYTQNPEQRPRNEYSYLEYDVKGRPRAGGTDVFDATRPLTQDLADLPAAAGLNKQERFGYIYDDLSSFTA